MQFLRRGNFACDENDQILDVSPQANNMIVLRLSPDVLNMPVT